jgi:hypothetical protein
MRYFIMRINGVWDLYFQRTQGCYGAILLEEFREAVGIEDW